MVWGAYGPQEDTDFKLISILNSKEKKTYF